MFNGKKSALQKIIWSIKQTLTLGDASLFVEIFFVLYEKKIRDIGANLTDPMFRGLYGGSRKHPDDLDAILNRSWQQGLQKLIITVGTLNEADEALAMANSDERLYTTMGCHPTRCGDFVNNPDEYYESLRAKISSNLNKIVAVGECGLDYDRLHFCEKDIQKLYFEKQLQLAQEFELPLFLHCRKSHEDFIEILSRNRSILDQCGGGVVHSFTGTLEEAQQVIDFHPNLYIGINGCSLKTEDNLNVVTKIPNNRILLETDCPWCGIRPSHACQKFVQTKFSVVKKKEKWNKDSLIDGRSEPCQIIQVLEVIAGVKDQDCDKLAEIFYDNTIRLFFSKRK